MRKSKQFIIQSNGQFDENDVAIARGLARKVRNGHLWNGISKEMLSLSDKFDDQELYKKYDSTKESFWHKIKNFDPYDQTWDLFSKAIMEFDHEMGCD